MFERSCRRSCQSVVKQAEEAEPEGTSAKQVELFATYSSSYPWFVEKLSASLFRSAAVSFFGHLSLLSDLRLESSLWQATLQENLKERTWEIVGRASTASSLNQLVPCSGSGIKQFAFFSILAFWYRTTVITYFLL